MVDGQKFLVVRFGTNIVEDCVEKHQEVINDFGYCWFGKIGVGPSQKLLQSVFEEEEPTLVLYTRNQAYVCELIETTEDRPVEGYPSYYTESLFYAGRNPKIYFKIKSMKKWELSELSRCVVCSSGNSLIQTLNKSMSSFFFAEMPDLNGVRSNRLMSVKADKNTGSEKKEKLDINNCFYRKDGKCSLKSFVNFQYDCTRPSTCIKQKR